MISEPLITTTFRVTLRDFELCSNYMGRRVKQRQMYKSIVLGLLFIIFALGFIGYLLFRVHRWSNTLGIPSLILLAIGVYNVLYYPLFFEKALARKNHRVFHRAAYFKNSVTLEFHDDYLLERSARGDNKVMWQTVYRLVQWPELYFLQTTSQSGIVIPKTQMDAASRETVDTLLHHVMKKFSKDITTQEI